MRLQTILKPNTDICDVSELYFHEDDEYLFADGFFNLFYIEKHKKYTDLTKLNLCIRLQGWSELIIMHDHDEAAHTKLDAEILKDYVIALPYDKYDTGVFWFKLRKYSTGRQCDGAAERDVLHYQFADRSYQYEELSRKNFDECKNKEINAYKDYDRILNGYYAGVSSKRERTVNIAVDICTYKREAYVIRNMHRVCNDIFRDESKAVREHLQIILIDNGQTLADNAQMMHILSDEHHIKLYPNKNAGGAGGFTRGMLEVLKHNAELSVTANADKAALNDAEISICRADGSDSTKADAAENAEYHMGKFTHVLLMDDDASFDPDMFVRLYGFLSQLKDEYAGITVGGALMREDIPCYQYASGEQYKHHKAYNPYIMRDMSVFENCTSDYMCKAAAEPDTYSGWWCCCYSTDTVRADNLPLPVFIHCDDIEYGLRNQDSGIVFLNGVCVWHRGFEYIYPAANRYYDIRNKLITSVLHEQDMGRAEAVKIVCRAMTASLLGYRYAEAEFAYRGLKDFCRGPAWLLNSEPEKLNNDIRSNIIQFEPYEMLQVYFTDGEWQHISERLESLSDNEYLRQHLINKYECNDNEKHPESQLSLKQKLSLNGWLLPAKKTVLHDIKLMSADDPVSEAYREPQVILYDPTGRKAIFAKRSYAKFFRCLSLYIRAVWIALFRYNGAAEAYRRKLKRISSYDSWERYLGQ